jgi:hypothetical protein
MSALPIDPDSRDVESRLRESLEEAHSALERARLLVYATATRNDPVITEGMAEIAAHLKSGEPFEDAVPVADFVDRKKQALTD